jgi:mannose/fructose/sorbose-specific phosphotransferase system IIA component
MSQIGVVLASHGELACAMLASAELIVGQQANVAAVCLEPDDSLESFNVRLCQAVDGAERGAGVLVLIDLFGGTPANAAAMGLCDREYSVVAGANLPMLLEVLMSRDSGLSVTELCQLALEAGRSAIVDVGAAVIGAREP